MKNSLMILESGNKQFVCKSNDKILVDLLNCKKGEKIQINRIFNNSNLVNDTIECEVLEPRKLGEKIKIYKAKRRKGYRKRRYN